MAKAVFDQTISNHIDTINKGVFCLIDVKCQTGKWLNRFTLNFSWLCQSRRTFHQKQTLPKLQAKAVAR